MKIGVIGAGGWGTARANLLAGKDLAPALWCNEPELVDKIKTGHENPYYLSGIKLEEGIEPTADLAEGVANAESIYKMSQKYAVEMPVTEQVYLLLYAQKSLKLAVSALMGRKLKSEFWS